MAFDSRYIAAFNIEDVLLDKDTGAPLAGGIVTFEKANQPGILKDVFQITYTSGVYNYAPLPNPMTLSSIGTFVDALDNPVIPYFYPYDAAGDIELYRVKVESSGLVPQFVRDPVPSVPASGDASAASAFENEISNAQFSEVLFDTSTATYTYDCSSTSLEEINIAPDWDIVVSASGVASVTVSQIRPTGAENILTNPGTILKLNSTGLSHFRLRQRLYGSPNLWGSGYLAATFVAKTFAGTSSVLRLYYSQSHGTVVDQQIVSATLASSGNYTAYPGSFLIPVSTSNQSFPDAYIDIEFDIPINTEIGLTSVMLASTGATSISGLVYSQDSQNRQIDHLFHYYKPQLDYKTIPSYLVGWDFPLNPAQLYGNTVAAQAVGANKSYYAWDQTILFQSANSGISVTRSSTSGLLVLQAAATTQMAVIQYLDSRQAQEILTQLAVGGVSVNVQMASTVSQVMTASLWWSANPIGTGLTTNDSLVTGLDANGFPTVAAGWNEVARGALGKAQLTSGAGLSLTDFGFSGFVDTTAYPTGVSFAIVIGSSSITAGNYIEFRSISLVPGKIPTIPAPQQFSQVLSECQHYYIKSFPLSTAPANNAGFTSCSCGVQTTAGGSSFAMAIRFPQILRTIPGVSNVTLYNPTAGTAGQVYNSVTASSWTLCATNFRSEWGFTVEGTPIAGGVGQSIFVHWAVDARLGII